VEPLALCGEQHPLRGARVDVVYDSPVVSGTHFDVLLNGVSLRIYQVGFGNGPVLDALTSGEGLTITSYRDVVSEVVVISAAGSQLEVRTFNVYASGYVAGEIHANRSVHTG
jgi:hypothetical protein